MEKLNNYQKPTMRVVRLQQRGHMLAGSPGDPSDANCGRGLRSVWKDDEE